MHPAFKSIDCAAATLFSFVAFVSAAPSLNDSTVASRYQACVSVPPSQASSAMFYSRERSIQPTHIALTLPYQPRCNTTTVTSGEHCDQISAETVKLQLLTVASDATFLSCISIPRSPVDSRAYVGTLKVHSYTSSLFIPVGQPNSSRSLFDPP